METKKALSPDHLNALKETVRQRFDELYHRIGSNRQNLMNKVLFVHHQINKELTKETIDEDHEKEILRKVRETERAANNQLPLMPKVIPASPGPAATTPPPAKTRPVSETKPKESKPKESKPKEAKESKPKPVKNVKAKPAAKASKAKGTKSKPAKKKKK